MKNNNFSKIDPSLINVSDSLRDAASRVKSFDMPREYDIPHSAQDLLDFTPKPPEVSKDRLNYEDSLFSDLAEDVKVAQAETTRQLQIFIKETRESEKFSRKVIVSTLVVSVLTLLVTAVGLALQHL